MIYLTKLNSHEEFESVKSRLKLPNVVYDNIHVHYLKKEEQSQPITEIWYTTTDGEIFGMQALIDMLIEQMGGTDCYEGPAIISETYVNGKGVIKFDAPVDVIGVDTRSSLALYPLFYDAMGSDRIISVSLPSSVVYMGLSAFGEQGNLTGVTLSEDLTNISDNAFQGSQLTFITIPDMVSNIGENAFYCVESLTSATIGDSVLRIGSQAFQSCTNLVNLIFGNHLETIEQEAFYTCQSLSVVTLPASLVTIGHGAFSLCQRLTTINYLGTIEQWNAIEKADIWHAETPATVVHCSDGDVNL